MSLIENSIESNPCRGHVVAVPLPVHGSGDGGLSSPVQGSGDGGLSSPVQGSDDGRLSSPV